MAQIQLRDDLYKTVQRRAHAAGFASVDDFVSEQLEVELSLEREDFDPRFTPPVLEHLDRLSNESKAGKTISSEDVRQHISNVRAQWLKDHAG
jgi:PHD/YefM family antitoxin component YafN of YafNO toxin-antitoxin module